MEKREPNLSKKCHLKWSGQKLDQVISKSNCFSIAAAAEHSLNLGEFGIPYQSSQKNIGTFCHLTVQIKSIKGNG